LVSIPAAIIPVDGCDGLSQYAWAAGQWGQAGETDQMPTFRSEGFRDVEAQSAQEAAEIFATRQARRDYGKNGHYRTMRLDSWTENGKSHTFEAFIGKPVPGDRFTTSGRNIWIYVRRVD